MSMVKELIAKYSRLNDAYNSLIKESMELQKQLERAEEVLEKISTSTVEVGFYVEPTWEAGLAREYFKNKEGRDE